jgi:hypothetical protein
MLFCAAIVCAGLLVLTCSKNDNPSGPGGVNSTWTYTVSGTDLIVSHPQSIETDCAGSYVTADTTFAYSDTSWFALSVNSDTMFVEGDQGDTMFLTRIGTGTGIQGQWLMSQGDFEATIEVGTQTITASTCFGDIFMAGEALWIELSYNITVSQLSCSSVRLTGNTSGEQVTINYTQTGNSPDNMDADITYSSSNAQHAPGTVFANPTTCPNDEPGWLDTFLLENNAAPAAKSAAQPALPAMKFPKIRLFR